MYIVYHLWLKDGVFIFTGIEAASTPFKGLIKTDNSGFIITDELLRTSQDGIFAAGAVRTTPFRQVVTAASDGALAAHMAEKYISRT